MSWLAPRGHWSACGTALSRRSPGTTLDNDLSTRFSACSTSGRTVTAYCKGFKLLRRDTAAHRRMQQGIQDSHQPARLLPEKPAAARSGRFLRTGSTHLPRPNRQTTRRPALSHPLRSCRTNHGCIEMEAELETARRTLNERQIIEAQGVLM